MVSKKSKATLMTGALAVAQKVLASEEVRRQLANAPRGVMEWAKKKRAERRADGPGRFDPTARFGQKGLERRVESIAGALALAFPNEDDPGRQELTDAIVRLRLALAVAKPMPLVKRKQAQTRIAKELDTLEAALVDAVLPPRRLRPSAMRSPSLGLDRTFRMTPHQHDGRSAMSLFDPRGTRES